MASPVVVVKQEGRQPLYVVVRDPIDVGRECDGILLVDAQASRRHARLTPREGTVLVEDVGSTNGTYLDGARIESPVVLRDGSVVRIGNSVLQLAGDAPVAAPAATAADGSRSTTVAPDPYGAAVRAAPSGPSELRETSMDAVARAVNDEDQPLEVAEVDYGTITIVFSDIESSTERATALGDAAWMKVLAAHNEIVRRHVDAGQGTVVKNQGDGFMIIFNGARRALRAMIGVQQALASHALDHADEAVRVRVGVHTGEVIAEEGDIFGKHVMVAARVGGLAAGGQILVSSIVREITSARGDLKFGEPEVVALKGIEGEQTVYPLLWEDFAGS